MLCGMSESDIVPEPGGAPGAKPGTDQRAQAAAILARWFDTGAFPDRLLDDSAPTDTRTRAWLQEVVHGAARWNRTLDWMGARLATRAPDSALRAFLHVGLYQLWFMTGVPEYAAVGTTVAAARARLHRSQAGFLNALLRRVCRERAALAAALAREPLAVRASHPDELVARWSKTWDAATVEALCAWNNTRPRVCVTTRGNTAEMFAAQAATAGLPAGLPLTPHPADARFWIVPRGARLDALPGFAAGHVIARDPATRLAIDLCAARPGEIWWDPCAAPGGKTVALADALAGQGRLVAGDAHADRLSLLQATLARAGLGDWVEVRQADLLTLTEAQIYDGILLDVPCSNTGVLARRPDARWRFSATRLDALTATQAELLARAWLALRPGGRLIYSTCSLEPEENRAQIAAFLGRHPDARLDAEQFAIPVHTATDGAYAARLIKRD